MGMLETAQGKFSNAWVAVYRDKHGVVYYGYGNTQDEAKTAVLNKLPTHELTEIGTVETRETYRANYAT